MPAETDAAACAAFHREQLPSYLSLDVDGRVMRCDSFSKAISSGVRVGWCTLHRRFSRKLVLLMQARCLSTSRLAQNLVHRLLRHWGPRGLGAHLNRTALFYGRQRDLMERAAAAHLRGLCEWETPASGMFFWFRVTHPPAVAHLGQSGPEGRFQGLGTHALLHSKVEEMQVILIPGLAFRGTAPAGDKARVVAT